MKRCRLSELCLLVTDGTHDSPKLLSRGVPFIKGKHISSGIIDFEHCDFISHEDHLKVISRSKPEQGDILFSNIGSLCVSSDDFVHQATQTSQGTKMPRANWGVLTRYPIALPGAHLLDRFNDIVNPIIQLINNLVLCNRCLRKNRDLLLPKLVSGQIIFEQVEIEVISQAV